MNLAKLVSRFVFDPPAAPLVDVRSVPVDPDLAARNAARQEQARQALGARWICARPVKRAARRR